LVLHQLKKLSLDFFSYDKLRNEFDSSSFADNKENFSNSEHIVVSPLNTSTIKEKLYWIQAEFDWRALFNFGSFHTTNHEMWMQMYSIGTLTPELFIVTGAPVLWNVK
jgi:vitamin B12 transporter